jgi:putative intracellular protease/amidase
MTNILIVLSAADKWTRADGSIYESGVWAQEFVDLDEAFMRAGFKVDLASPGGIVPTMDKRSLDPNMVGENVAERMRAYLDKNAERIENPLVLAEVDAAGYDAIIVPGGHGPVEDLYKDPDMGRVLIEADKADKVIAAVCHGPAALLAARDENGGWPFAGRKMTSSSERRRTHLGCWPTRCASRVLCSSRVPTGTPMSSRTATCSLVRTRNPRHLWQRW